MNNRSIAWWLRQIGLPQYTKTLESSYYGLEGLFNITDGDLKEVGVDDADHRATLLNQIQKHRQKLLPKTDPPVVTRGRVSRKYSLGSSLDLIKPRTSLYRQNIVPRLQRQDYNTLSSSCSQLRPPDEVVITPCDDLQTLPEDQPPPPVYKRRNKASRRRSVAAFISQVFGGRKDMDALKKELEEELKLSTEDVRSHAWYHGALSRESAEVLLEKDGDFLVRDSKTSTGDYVMSCRWKDEPMHFKIIRIMLRPKKGSSGLMERFQFEDDQFDNIPALVRFHVGGKKPISHSAGVIIHHPVTRTVPLRVIDERQAARTSSATSRDRSKRCSLNTNQMDTLQVHNTLLRSGSQPANLENVGRPSLQSAQSDSNLRPATPHSSQSETTSPSPISPVFRTGSDPVLSPCGNRHQQTSQTGSQTSVGSALSQGGSTLRGSDGQLHSRAPPKPLRISILLPGIPPSPSNSQSDPSNIYDELRPQIPPSLQPRGHAARLRAEEKWQSRARVTDTSFGFLEEPDPLLPPPRQEVAEEVTEEEEGEAFERPQLETTSCFHLDQFNSLLLPENNRPLEQSVLVKVKELFSQTSAKTTALHMLSVDCQVARITGVTAEQRRLMGVGSGLELITLPHGSQLRQDLLERHHVIALAIAVDVLGCTGTMVQRAAVLHKVIQLAEELRSAAHDLYAFSAVMKALEMPQVVRLEQTWRALRRNHTESAVLFEKTHKPFMKSLNEGDDSVAPGPLSVPHIVPLLKLMEGEDNDEHTERGCELLYNTLQSARHSALNAQKYQQHAHNLLSGGWEPIPELLEAFRTEFALRLLWGHAGAKVGREERYTKFDKILTVLSSRLESVKDSEV
ncbi:breast cancer anti-estrogen resistance protein 3 [Denticeps clupeoides]|uniref:Breast cancer anti-estrogen resistance protein 3-like n=1 Tax=Denticeps clupeoides TaxID=299321 RepID=A0AAY4BES6_9TELE|nr:breast cancer anti-estrogen resistance protein 3-like [Denticeps clupeoides]